MPTAPYAIRSSEQSANATQESFYNLQNRLSHAGMPTAAIVIPCYNEEKRLPVDELKRHLAAQSGIQFVFVDDGSKDRTAEVLANICAETDNRSRFVSLARNSGKAEAVRLGILDALASGTPDYVGFWDADLATPISAIDQFLNILETKKTIDMVFGSRVRLLGRDIKRKTYRHYLGRLFATVVSSTLKLPIYDTQCGAKIFRVTPEVETVFSTPFLSKWIFDVEIIARFANLRGSTNQDLADVIYEFPLESWEDVAGSKVGGQDFLVAAADLLKIRNRYL